MPSQLLAPLSDGETEEQRSNLEIQVLRDIVDIDVWVQGPSASNDPVPRRSDTAAATTAEWDSLVRIDVSGDSVNVRLVRLISYHEDDWLETDYDM